MCQVVLFAAAVLATHVDGMLTPSGDLDAFTKSGKVTLTDGNRADGRHYTVTVGEVSGRAVFVVIAVGPADGEAFTNPVRTSASLLVRRDGTMTQELESTLTLPEASSLALPVRLQLFEVADGKFRLSDRRVTPAEVQAYLDSKPKACSLDDLIRFVEVRRKGRT